VLDMDFASEFRGAKWAKSPESYGESSFLTWTWPELEAIAYFQTRPNAFDASKMGI
jgi:hypothetical protein